LATIYKKEMDSYFNSMLGYVFIAIFLFLSGFYFTMNNLVARSGDVAKVFSNISYLMIVITPLLTMRSFAEEKKNKTEILLLTSTVSLPKIVMGKFLSALSVMLVALVVTLVYAMIAFALGEVFVAEVVVGYVGFLLLSACLIAVGLFVSSLTENQLIAAVVTMGLLLMMWLLDMLRPAVSNPVALSLIYFISPFANFASFGSGVLRLSSLCYMVSFIVMFLSFITLTMGREGGKGE